MNFTDFECCSQMQLRDYPRPLIAITEATANGKMILAEQEARDRGEGVRSVWSV